MISLAQPLAALFLFIVGPLAALAPKMLAYLAFLAPLAMGLSVRKLPRLDLSLAFALLLAGWGLASALWAPQPPRAIAAAALIAGLALAWRWGSQSAGQATADARQLWSRGLAAGIGLGLPLALVEAGLGAPFYRLVTPDALPNENVYNRPLVALALLVWPLGLALMRRFGALAGVALVAGFAALTLALTSQSASLGLAAGLAAFALARILPRVTALAVGLCFMAALLAAPLLSPIPYKLGLATDESLPQSARHRAEIWAYFSEKSLERPLQGQGLDASRDLLVDHGGWTWLTNGHDVALHPHQAGLQIWLELGLVGALLAYLACRPGLVGLWRRGADRPFVIGGASTGLVMASTAYGVWQGWWLGAMLLTALAFSLLGDRKEDAP